MIPIRDTITPRHFPIVNYLIIAVNALVYLVQLTQGPVQERFIYTYGLVPARYSVPDIAAYFTLGQQVVSIFTFMFLHGGFWHLLGNMWSLHIFGDNVEDRLGPFRYLVFYLLCGMASGVSHLLLNLGSNAPVIGASGAIAGVMGAYFVLHPSSRILTLIPIIFIPWFVEIPAFFFLGIWFILQFLNAAATHGGVSGIAWWAHIGGFIFGIIFLKMFARLPPTGISERVGPVTEKRTTHRLQMIRPTVSNDSPHLLASLDITPYEARNGSQKLVNVPWGFHTRLIKVIVPPGIQTGKLLRLKGLGRQAADGSRGDLLLKVTIR
jgi:membrane associated rhomboid family serine protease